MPGPLHGVTVLDLTQVVLGPWATQILGDMGAEIIKVEPLSGDITRQIGPARNAGMASLFLAVNRNKRSVAINLKSENGRKLLLEMARGADVIIHAMRPNAVDRLGLSYEEVAAVQPKIIYVACHGFRSNGPYAGRAAYDDVIQSLSGLVHLQERVTGVPCYVPTIVCDKNISLLVVANVAMALLHRFRTGQGQRIETTMFENMVAFSMIEHLHGATFEPPLGTIGHPRVLASSRRPYATRDGGVVTILPYNEGHWRRFTQLPGFEHFALDPRFSTVEQRHLHADALYEEIGATVRLCMTKELLEALTRADIPFTEVKSLDDVLNDPHLAALDLWRIVEHETEGLLRTFGIPSEFSRTPGSIRRLPPRLGEHTQEVLKEFDVSDKEIAALQTSGVVAQADDPTPP